MAERLVSAADVAMRFRRDTDWFVVSRYAGVHAARIGTTSERAVDLLPTLATHLDPAVDLYVEDLRDGECWEGLSLALPDVREVLGRLRLPLATYGGVEIALVTAEDQLTLTPELELVVYARTDRWLFLLDGMGLAERAAPPPPVWRGSRASLTPAPDLSAALAAAAERLGLRRCTSGG